MAPGPHTRPLPTTGRTANTIVTTPQKTALGRWTIQNPTPTSSPCTAAVRPVPMIVEVVTSTIIGTRSEEHTSELQSLRHLVCRLLLEKKKTIRNGVQESHEEKSGDEVVYQLD